MGKSLVNRLETGVKNLGAVIGTGAVLVYGGMQTAQADKLDNLKISKFRKAQYDNFNKTIGKNQSLAKKIQGKWYPDLNVYAGESEAQKELCKNDYFEIDNNSVKLVSFSKGKIKHTCGIYDIKKIDEKNYEGKTDDFGSNEVEKDKISIKIKDGYLEIKNGGESIKLYKQKQR